MKMFKMVLLLLVGMSIIGCGKKWEHMWGQDIEPEKVYIPMTPNLLEFPNNSDRIELTDVRFRTAKFMSVWVCQDGDTCVELPYKGVVVVKTYKESVLVIINSYTKFPAYPKIRIMLVMQ